MQCFLRGAGWSLNLSNLPLNLEGGHRAAGCQGVAEGLRPVGYGMARPLWIMSPGGGFAPPPPWALFYVGAVFMPQCAPQCVHCTEGTTCHLAAPYPWMPARHAHPNPNPNPNTRAQERATGLGHNGSFGGARGRRESEIRETTYRADGLWYGRWLGD